MILDLPGPWSQSGDSSSLSTGSVGQGRRGDRFMRNAIVLAAVTLVFLFAGTGVAEDSADPQLGAYFIEWGVYNAPHYYVKHIVESGAADKITVLYYAFVIPAPGPDGHIIATFDDPYAAYQQPYDAAMSVDGVADTESDQLKGHFNQLSKLKDDNPELKILIALGGWLGSTYFSDAALTQESRVAFVESCIDLFIRGNLPVGEGGMVVEGVAAGIFDGFDIDWEYPITGGAGGTHHNQNDDANLTLLLGEFRRQLDDIDEGLLLTMATPGSAFRGDNFQINQDQHHVDWFNLMTYDFHGGWDNKTGHHTNLLTSPDDPSSDAFKLSIDNAVRLYRDTYGVAEHKLVIGSAFYGRGWKGVSSTDGGLYQSGREAPGIYEPGYNYYRDLIPLLDRGYEMYWDDKALASWLYSPDERIFWTLDEPQSLALKKRYADAYGLRGVMFWEISGDDNVGTLVKTLYTGNPPGGVASTGEDSPLTVHITSPVACGLSFEGFNVVINAQVQGDSVAPAQVEFFHGETSLGYDTQEPFSCAWFNVPSGGHELTATVTDVGGGKSVSDPVTINVYSTSSGITLWQTGAVYQVGDQVFYEGCIYAAARLHTGSRVRTPSADSRYWDLVTCEGCTGGGGNEPPMVTITDPTNNASYTEGSEISIVAVASDLDGSVTGVEFFANGALLVGYSAAPYEYVWTPPSPGSYALTAVATDNGGATTTSAVVNITVGSSGGGGCVDNWDSTITYYKNDIVFHNGIKWRAKRTVTGVEPGTSPSQWANLGPCD
jgi:chitinase